MENDIVKITVEYEDGTTREVNKGFLCTMTPMEDGIEFTFDMLHISGEELKDIVGGMLQLGMKLYGSQEDADDE